MLLTRRVGEEIIIDGKIRVKVVAMHNQRVRLGVMAPETVAVDRAEIHQRRTALVGVSEAGDCRPPCGDAAGCPEREG